MSLIKETKYLRLAETFADTLSKDRSTRVGAFFLHPTEFTILTAGYNGIPRGCDDDLAERHERPLKYEFFEHAERNAIYNAVRKLFRGCTVVAAQPLEVDDIRAIVSVGAAVLCTAELPGATATQLLQEAGVLWTQPLPDAVAGDAVQFKFGARVVARAAGSTRERDSAVRTAIFDAARPLLAGSTAVVGPLPPCAACARALAAVGVRRVVSNRPSEDHVKRWGASFELSRLVYEEHGMQFVEA